MAEAAPANPAAAAELAPTVTEMAPGVYRLRAGEPEKIVPSLVKNEANQAGLKAMPEVSQSPLPIGAVHFVRMRAAAALNCRSRAARSSTAWACNANISCRTAGGGRSLPRRATTTAKG